MNKKEVSEIKSLFKRDGGAIDRICGCLIDGEQQIRMTFSDMFLSLSQEEIDKYFEIFRKALSGSLGKNLHSLDYTLDQELSGEGHKRLMQLKATGLKDETVLEEFYKSVAETYHFGESYYVVMIHCNYDVPGRGSDNLDMDDASEEFKALEKKLNHDLDRDLDYFSSDIKKMIATEIIKRYYYQRGNIIQQLKDDDGLKEAMKILNDPVKYKEMLSAPVAKK